MNKSMPNQIAKEKAFFDIKRFPINSDTKIEFTSQSIRLDQEQKAKACYSLQVVFNKAESDQQTIITLKKLYGDFKKLHNHILMTFDNELKEYQKIEELTSSGELKAS